MERVLKQIKFIVRFILLFLRRVKSIFLLLLNIKKYVCQQSYYPECPRKCFCRIAFDFICHVAKYEDYGNVDEFYFVYGLDRKSANVNDYMPYGQVKALLVKANLINGNGTSYACLLENKYLFSIVCNYLHIPTPKLIAKYSKGKILFNETIFSLQEFCEKLPENSHLFFKIITATQGKGAFAFDKINGKYFVDNQSVSLEKLLDNILKNEEYIIQERLIQHEELNKLYPYSLNTLRIVSVIDDGKVSILGAVLRMGVGRSVVDNWHQGGVAVGITDNGELMHWGLFMPGRGTKTDCHPNTGIAFNGFKLPYWRETVALLTETHSKFASIKAVGWDIAVTPKGPVVIEGNVYFDIAILQACTGGKRLEFQKYFNYRGFMYC